MMMGTRDSLDRIELDIAELFYDAENVPLAGGRRREVLRIEPEPPRVSIGYA
ncbi:MAG: hypothetical protein ABJG15_12020 [Hyphomonadaceae bacterium]